MKIIHTKAELPSWLSLTLRGAEGDPGENPLAEEATNDPADPDDSEDPEPEELKELPEDHPLKLALRAERRLRKAEARRAAAAERDARALKAAEDKRALEAKSEEEQNKILRERAEEKTTKLAAKLLKTSLDNAIEKAAQAAKFIDTDDALSGVDRSKIIAEQDADDPSVVIVDMKSVTQAVTELATKKAHLIRPGTEDGEPTGSRFAPRPRGKKLTDDEALRSKYPSLQ